MPQTLVVEPIVARLTRIDGVLGLHERAETFDYACSRARAEAIDLILLGVVDERGWSLFDDGVVDRVSVEHDGPTRARILVDGRPATRWWQDRVVRSESEIVWHFEPTQD